MNSSIFCNIFGLVFHQTKQKSVLFCITFPRSREHFNLVCIQQKSKSFNIPQFKISTPYLCDFLFKQFLSFMNTDSNPKRNSYHKCILQKEAKNKRSASRLPRKATCRLCVPRTACESFSEASEGFKCIKLKTMPIKRNSAGINSVNISGGKEMF